MADQKVTDLTNLTGPPADGDEFHIVDVSDTTDDPAGSSKALTITELMSFHRPGSFRDTGSTNIINTASTTVGLDAEILDPEGNYSLAAGVVTVTTAGYYSISYSLPVNEDGTTGATRTRVFAWVGLNGTTAIVQSRSQCYIREASGGAGVSASFVAQLSASDTIQIEVQTQANTDCSTETGEAQLSIFRVA